MNCKPTANRTIKNNESDGKNKNAKPLQTFRYKGFGGNLLKYWKGFS